MAINSEKLFYLTSKLFNFSKNSASSEIIEKVVDLFSKELQFLGQDLLSETYSPINSKAIVFCVIALIFLLRLLAKVLIFSESTDEFLINLINFCVLTETILRTYVFIKNHRLIPKLVTMVKGFYRTTEGISQDHAMKLKKWSTNISYVSFFIMLGTGTFGTFNLCLTIATIQSDTWFQYFASLAFTFAFLVILFSLLEIVLSAIFFVSIHAFVQYKSIMVSVKQLEELIMDNDSGFNNGKIEKMMAIIVEAQVELSNYMKTFNDLLSMTFLVEFIMSIPHISALLTRISINFTVYYEYTSLATTLLSIFSSCLLGSLLDVQHDACFASLSEISWTKLTTKQRKWLHMMLMASNRNNCIKCGIWDHNLKLFVSLCNSAYSYLNFLLKLR
jgi:7tm Odorant receptor